MQRDNPNNLDHLSESELADFGWAQMNEVLNAQMPVGGGSGGGGRAGGFPRLAWIALGLGVVLTGLLATWFMTGSETGLAGVAIQPIGLELGEGEATVQMTDNNGQPLAEAVTDLNRNASEEIITEENPSSTDGSLAGSESPTSMNESAAPEENGAQNYTQQQPQPESQNRAEASIAVDLSPPVSDGLGNDVASPTGDLTNDPSTVAPAKSGTAAEDTPAATEPATANKPVAQRPVDEPARGQEDINNDHPNSKVANRDPRNNEEANPPGRVAPDGLASSDRRPFAKAEAGGDMAESRVEIEYGPNGEPILAKGVEMSPFATVELPPIRAHAGEGKEPIHFTPMRLAEVKQAESTSEITRLPIFLTETGFYAGIGASSHNFGHLKMGMFTHIPVGGNVSIRTGLNLRFLGSTWDGLIGESSRIETSGNIGQWRDSIVRMEFMDEMLFVGVPLLIDKQLSKSFHIYGGLEFNLIPYVGGLASEQTFRQANTGSPDEPYTPLQPEFQSTDTESGRRVLTGARRQESNFTFGFRWQPKWYLGFTFEHQIGLRDVTKSYLGYQRNRFNSTSLMLTLQPFKR